ncbi:ribonuclease H-like domain-containing protein [Tanacetum coccineum]
MTSLSSSSRSYRRTYTKEEILHSKVVPNINPNLPKQSGNNNKRFNGNSEVNHFIPSTSGSLYSSFTNKQIMKLLSLINEKPSFTIIDSGANQHMTDSTKDMFNIVDISNLMLTVGHPNGTLAKITAIGSLRLTGGIVLFDVFVVSGYNAKQTRKPFPLSDHKSMFVGDIIHCNVWGPYRVVSKNGYKFFLTLVDDFSKAVWVYLLQSITEVGDYIGSFIKLVFTQFGKKVKVIRSDNRTEFVNTQLSNLFNDLGIIHQTSCAYTP